MLHATFQNRNSLNDAATLDTRAAFDAVTVQTVATATVETNVTTSFTSTLLTIATAVVTAPFNLL